jgi:DNA-binding NtrC family response regulator
VERLGEPFWEGARLPGRRASAPKLDQQKRGGGSHLAKIVWFSVHFSKVGEPDEGVRTMGRTCLIVDDEPSIRGYLKMILQEEDFQVLEAGNAAQSFRLLQERHGDISLIISDIHMPGDMDGLDLAYAVRNAYQSIPIILISGYTDVNFGKNRLANCEFLQKPFVPSTIVETVRKLTGYGRQVARSAV